jgi:hypothetical protein
MNPYPHCDPSTRISALLTLRPFFIFAPRRTLSSMHLFSENKAASCLLGLLLPCPQAHARQPYGVVLGPSTFHPREVPSGRDWGCSLHKSVSPGTPFLAPSRTCTLSTIAHEIWRNRLESHRATNREGPTPDHMSASTTEHAHGFLSRLSDWSLPRMLDEHVRWSAHVCMCRPPIILTATPSSTQTFGSHLGCTS